MGRHPLSRTAAGKQIKDLKEDDKNKYQDVFRPPGIVRKRSIPKLEKADSTAPAGRGKDSSLSGQPDVVKTRFSLEGNKAEEKAASNTYSNEAERQLDELNRKIDKNIWMTMPNSYLYQRKYIENAREKRLKEERMAYYK